MDALPISRIILYVRDIAKVAAIYQKHFGLQPLGGAEDGWLEIGGPNGAASRCIRPRGRKSGDQRSRLSLRSRTSKAFTAERAAAGLKFGVIHNAGSHEFANARNPAGNSIQVSSRGVG